MALVVVQPDYKNLVPRSHMGEERAYSCRLSSNLSAYKEAEGMDVNEVKDFCFLV